jgi:glycosyltransferase involved in cell wall biosynthesis
MTSGTVAVCTHNRRAILEQCLASLETQIVEPDQLELLVVDNASNDGTSSFLDAWQSGGTNRRAVTEPRLGVVNARNTALRSSTRDVVLFVDDDGLVPPGWARAHLGVYTTGDRADRVGAVGGPVGLHWPVGRPAWMTDELTQWYSALDLGDDIGPFPTVHGPYGVNMSVRRVAVLEVGGFDPTLGRRGRRLLSGEEPDLTRRLRAAGWDVIYTPAAAVVQQVLPERLDRRWLRRRSWAQGVSNARLEMLADGSGRRADMVRSGFAELRDSGRRWRQRRTGSTDEEELAALLRILAHAAAGFEYLRAGAFTRPRGRAPAAGMTSPSA